MVESGAGQRRDPALRRASGIAGRAVTTGDTVNVRDAYSDPRFYTGIDDQTGYRTRNVLAVPVRNQRGEIIGAFEVLNKRAGVVHPRDEEALAALASHAAIAIETAQLDRRTAAQPGRTGAAERASVARGGEQVRAATESSAPGQRIQQVVRLIERIRDSVVNVLITGESGTGKELMAKAVHYTSPRARRPFVALNCAALPETLLESELFGIEKGVATGVNPRVGQFQKADGGTLFLDEIGDLSLTAQAKILRVLAGARGGTRGRPLVDRRWTCGCSPPRIRTWRRRSPRAHFREDLYYRIKVIHIHLPPLREIREEIPLLANHFLKEYCRESGRGDMEFSPDVLRKLSASPWPGNVRQLRNEVMRLAACARGSVIEEEDLWEGLPAPRREPAAAVATAKAAGRQSSEDRDRGAGARDDRRGAAPHAEQSAAGRPNARPQPPGADQQDEALRRSGVGVTGL